MASRFRYYKRLNRAGPGIAGAVRTDRRIWNGNWEARWDPSSDAQTLTAVADDVRFALRLTPLTPPVIQGENGVSSEGGGRRARRRTTSRSRGSTVEGTLNGAAVTGTAWMDHEWFTHQLDAVAARLGLVQRPAR